MVGVNGDELHVPRGGEFGSGGVEEGDGGGLEAELRVEGFDYDLLEEDQDCQDDDKDCADGEDGDCSPPLDDYFQPFGDYSPPVDPTRVVVVLGMSIHN